MKTLESAIVGEHVVIEYPHGRVVSKRVWRRIFRVTEKIIYTSSVSSGHRYRKADGRSMDKYDNGIMRYPTEEEVEARRAEVKARLKADEDHAAYLAREDVKMANQFASTETEEWLKLGEDRLRDIKEIMEAK